MGVLLVGEGKRPTFCKDCLRDYQRSVAKARNEIGAKQAAPAPSASAAVAPVPRTAHPKTYASAETPLLLAQLEHIGPKKFKPLRHRPSVNLDEVRALINDANSKER